MSYEEFIITDRGISLIDKLDVKYDYDGEVLIFHQPSDTLLSREFIENNNIFIAEELSMLNYRIDNIKFAIEHKGDSALAELKALYELRHIARKYLYEFRELVDRMY